MGDGKSAYGHSGGAGLLVAISPNKTKARLYQSF